MKYSCKNPFFINDGFELLIKKWVQADAESTYKKIWFED
jgi:hypothetical protein